MGSWVDRSWVRDGQLGGQELGKRWAAGGQELGKRWTRAEKETYRILSELGSWWTGAGKRSTSVRKYTESSLVKDGQLVDRSCGGGCKEYHISAGYSTGDHRGIPMLGI
jgi:hypothetical protein